MGRHRDLAQRRVAHPATPRAEHPRKRLSLVACRWSPVYAAPPQPEHREPEPARHLEADNPGDLVQLDCFKIGRLAQTSGVAWQYTAVDVASSYTWAEIWITPKNPSPRWTSVLAQRGAAELAEHGWQLGRVTTDGGGEFVAGQFRDMITRLGGDHVVVHRPQSNGCVERVQLSILDECWRPAFARHLIPKYTGLRHDLARYLHYYNTDRAHTGRNNRGQTPSPSSARPRCGPTNEQAASRPLGDRTC